MPVNTGSRSSRFSFRFSKIAVGLLVAALLLALVGIWLAAGRKNAAENLHREVRLLMDTEVTVVFKGDRFSEAEQISGQVFDIMEILEQRFSRSLTGSEISNINAHAGREAVEVSAETIDLLEQALQYSDLSKGAFDPTTAPLLDEWGFLDRDFRVPTASALETLLPLVDYTLVQVDPDRRRVSLLKEGTGLDLGGIAKGYIVDRGVDELHRAGIKHGFIDAGGDIGIAGPKADGEPWRIGIRNPIQSEKMLAVIPLSEGAITTSGSYERMFEREGQRYHHILDPRTGYPAGGLASVTVIAPTATEADALSTAVFVLGPEQGLKLIESLPGVEGFLVTPAREILFSSGLEGRIELVDD